jgi:hypothetical protein
MHREISSNCFQGTVRGPVQAFGFLFDTEKHRGQTCTLDKAHATVASGLSCQRGSSDSTRRLWVSGPETSAPGAMRLPQTGVIGICASHRRFHHPGHDCKTLPENRKPKATAPALSSLLMSGFVSGLGLSLLPAVGQVPRGSETDGQPSGQTLPFPHLAGRQRNGRPFCRTQRPHPIDEPPVGPRPLRVAFLPCGN